LAYTKRGEAYEAKSGLDHAIADFDQALKLLSSHKKAQRSRERVQALPCGAVLYRLGTPYALVGAVAVDGATIRRSPTFAKPWPWRRER
jgi:hypothetical protein